MRWRAWLGCACAVALLCAFGPSEARAEGSHFIAEMNHGVGVPLGYEDGYDPGYAFGLTLGFGGKFKGNPTRVYLLGQFNTVNMTGERVHNQRRRVMERQVTDANMGVRLLWPVVPRLRVFVDMALGAAQVDSETTSPDLPVRLVLRDTDLDFAVFTALGAQYRFWYHGSIGVKTDFGFVFDDDDVDVVSEAISDSAQDRTGRMNVYVTGTLHF